MDTLKEFLEERLNNKEITEQQRKIFYYFLITYACKIANTTSVFGAFLKSPAKYQPFNVSFVEKIIFLSSFIKSVSKIKNSCIFNLSFKT